MALLILHPDRGIRRLGVLALRLADLAHGIAVVGGGPAVAALFAPTGKRLSASVIVVPYTALLSRIRDTERRIVYVLDTALHVLGLGLQVVVSPLQLVGGVLVVREVGGVDAGGLAGCWGGD